MWVSHFKGRNNTPAEKEQIINKMIGALTTAARMREGAIEETKTFEVGAESPQHTPNHPTDNEGRERGEAEEGKITGEGAPKLNNGNTRQAHDADNDLP